MREIHLDGRRVAIAGLGVARLAEDLERLAPAHPRRRFAAAMCLYSVAIDDGTIAGTYSDAEAAAFARGLLIDAADLLARWEEPDIALAPRYGVPADQVARFRMEVLAAA
jgi:hypothetical protein